MKKYNNIFKTTVLLIVAVLTFSCNYKNDEPLVQPSNSILAIIDRNPDLSTFSEALRITGLKGTTFLGGSSPFTVFAPTNTAFNNFLTTNGFANLNAIPLPVLTEALKYHLIGSSIVTSSSNGFTGYLKTVSNGPASTTNPLYMFINNEVYSATSPTPTAGKFVKLNNVSTIIVPDISATNGVVHIVDAVIPQANIVTLVTLNPNLSQLTGKLTSAGQTYPTTLAGAGPFTVFAPTNAAFTTFNTEVTSLGTGGTLTTANLTKVLNYHVANGNALRAGLTNGLIINTLQTIPTQQNVTVQITPATVAVAAIPATPTTPFVPAVAAVSAVFRLVSANPVLPATARTSTITTVFDIQGTNGVIHLIDRVLLPL